MSYSAETPIRGHTTITADQAITYASRKVARGHYAAYLRFVWQHAPGLNLNPLVVMGQWWDETAGGTSAAWLGGNPAGIGMPPGAPNPFPPGITGEQSAAIHLAELASKVAGDPVAVVGEIDVSVIDPHWSTLVNVLQRMDWPIVRTLADLAKRFGPGNQEAVWATNRRYAAQIAAHMNSIATAAKEVPMSGLTPWPAIVERPLPDKFSAGMTWEYRPPFVASWWHSMVGWLWSTDGYFRLLSTRAATDYGIGGLGDGASDGVIFRWIDALKRPYATPWASGWDNAPDFDDQGAEFYRRFGPHGVNPGGLSIEFSGLVATPMTAKQWQSGIHLTAAIHHHLLKQSWEQFAWNMQHWEVAEKACPFDRIIRFTDLYQKAIVLVMRHFETGFDIPEFVPINGLKIWLPGGRDDGPVVPPPSMPIFEAFAKERRFTTRVGAISRQWATRDAEVVRHYLTATDFRSGGFYHGEEWRDADQWLVIRSRGASNNARIHVSQVRDWKPEFDV